MAHKVRRAGVEKLDHRVNKVLSLPVLLDSPNNLVRQALFLFPEEETEAQGGSQGRRARG